METKSIIPLEAIFAGDNYAPTNEAATGDELINNGEGRDNADLPELTNNIIKSKKPRKEKDASEIASTIFKPADDIPREQIFGQLPLRFYKTSKHTKSSKVLISYEIEILLAEDFQKDELLEALLRAFVYLTETCQLEAFEAYIDQSKVKGTKRKPTLPLPALNSCNPSFTACNPEIARLRAIQLTDWLDRHRGYWTKIFRLNIEIAKFFPDLRGTFIKDGTEWLEEEKS